MPIILPNDSGRPLSQGDVLIDINLFSTRGGWEDDKGAAAKSPHKLCMILSRPCAIEHSASVIVAGVEKLSDAVPRDIKTFKEVSSFLVSLRDSPRAPDVFYLGQLPDRDGRYGARFDELCTIEIPPVGPRRHGFVDSRRIGILHEDFRRDLHARLFRAIASLGFDDHRWLSDSDLSWLVHSGRTDLLNARAAVQALQADKSSKTAQGKQFSPKELETAEKNVKDIEECLQPYNEEFSRRGLS